MNKYQYRLVSQYDDYDVYECINCKEQFEATQGLTAWQCCPVCTIKWSGEFTKRNPRYHLSSKSYPEYPRLQIKIGTYYLEAAGLFDHKKKLKRGDSVYTTMLLHPRYHAAPQSISNTMRYLYTNACKFYPHVELSLFYSATCKKVIKQYERSDLKEYLADMKKQVNQPIAMSGVL